MKLHKIKTNIKSGFTLVELMIVVAIIGVLAATLLPQLQGGQARSRDAGRIASLSNAVAVLDTYYADEGEYPVAPSDPNNDPNNANGCLSNGSGATYTDLAALFKGGKAPLNPQKASVSKPCATPGAFAYETLIKDDIANSSFIIMSDIETYKKANAWIPGNNNFDIYDDDLTYDIVMNSIEWGIPDAEAADATDTVYAITN